MNSKYFFLNKLNENEVKERYDNEDAPTDSDLWRETQALSCKVIKKKLLIIIYKNQFTNFVRDLCDGEERESMFVLKLF